MPIAVTPKIALCLREITMATITSHMLVCMSVSPFGISLKDMRVSSFRVQLLAAAVDISLSVIKHFWVGSNNNTQKTMYC